MGGDGEPRRETPGSPAPADTRKLSKGASLPNIAKSLRGGKGSCRRARKAAFEAAAGTGQGAGWGCLLSHPLAHWEPHASLTSWIKIRPGFHILGWPRPTQPSQLDPPKTGSLLSAAFYRTIKPKVQVRSLRPVIKKGRLCLPYSSCLFPYCRGFHHPAELLGCWLPSLSLIKILQPQKAH